VIFKENASMSKKVLIVRCGLLQRSYINLVENQLRSASTQLSSQSLPLRSICFLIPCVSQHDCVVNESTR